MPNTLSHIAVHCLIFGRFVNECSIKWIILGTLLPDIPWILRKALGTFPGLTEPYTLRMYAIIQASFLFCLILCIALSMFSKRVLNAFFLLAMSCLTHLILDALEIKYSAGIYFFIPFSWYSFDLPVSKTDGAVAVVLTLCGVIVAVVLCVRVVIRHMKLASGRRLMEIDTNAWRMSLGGVALLSYLVLPILFMNKAITENVGSIRTLVDQESRPGKSVRFDREWLKVRDNQVFLSTFANEDLLVDNLVPNFEYDTRKVSGIVEFVTSESVNFKVIHIYENYWRDWASYPGLLFIIFYFYIERRIR